MSRWPGLVAAFFGLLLPLRSAEGQGHNLFVEVGGSSVSPPAGIEGDDARFLVAGLRGRLLGSGGSRLFVSVLGGRSLEEGSGGDFFSGSMEGQVRKRLSPGWSAGMGVKVFGFRVADPFPYRSLGAEGGPSLQFANRWFSARLEGVAGGGWSRTELQRSGRFPAEVVEDELWRYGAAGEVLAGLGGVLAGLAVGVHESAGGTYRSAGLRFLAEWGGPALELRVDGWHTPSGHETTGGVAFVFPFGGWDLRGFLGRTEPDPLTLAEPGGGSAGLLVGRRIAGTDRLPDPKAPLHEVLTFSGSTARVRIEVEAPPGTQDMEIMGDFTLWEPVRMARDGSAWSVELSIPEGIHHFGFLADGEWYLPEDAPDTVPDEWGRRNGTIVIEG